MRSKKLTTLPILLILALSLIGFAYANWQQTLYINGTVETGELDWEYVGTSSIDPDGVNDYQCRDGFAGPSPLFWPGDKNVGYTTVEITDPHTVTVMLHNVYPSYFVSVSVYAQNSGTIPLIIEKVVIDGTEITTMPAPIVRLDLDGDLEDDIEIRWLNGIGWQMEPYELAPEMSFWIHILQDAPQGATLSFSVSIVGIQWNMYVPP